MAVDPTTGRVLAYYGGDNGTGYDYAGPTTTRTATSWVAATRRARRSRSTRWRAALSDGISARHRTGTPTPMKARRRRKISNAGRDNADVRQARCTLRAVDGRVVQLPVLLARREDRRRTRWSRRPSKAGVSTCAAPNEIGERARPDQGRAEELAPATSATRSASASTRSPCSTTPTAWPRSPTAASTTRRTSS